MDFEVIRTYVNQFRSAQVSAENHAAKEEDKDPEYAKNLDFLRKQLPQNQVLSQIPEAQHDSEYARIRTKYEAASA